MISRVFRYTIPKRSLSTKVPKIKDPKIKQPKIKQPKKFHEIPYHEQYESRDFIVTINENNIPNDLTINKQVSSELSDIINSKYCKKTIKEEFKKSGKFISNFKYSPW